MVCKGQTLRPTEPEKVFLQTDEIHLQLETHPLQGLHVQIPRRLGPINKIAGQQFGLHRSAAQAAGAVQFRGVVNRAGVMPLYPEIVLGKVPLLSSVPVAREVLHLSSVPATREVLLRSNVPVARRVLLLSSAPAAREAKAIQFSEASQAKAGALPSEAAAVDKAVVARGRVVLPADNTPLSNSISQGDMFF